MSLQISGGGAAWTKISVVTRRGFDAKALNALFVLKEGGSGLRAFIRVPEFHGPDLTCVVQAGKSLTGVITDSKTGAPVKGCTLSTGTGYGEAFGAISDDRGRYALDGLTKNPGGYSFSISPPAASSYLGRNLTAPDTEGFAPVRLDIQLLVGAVVTGRVIDRETGKGMRADIRVLPSIRNKLIGTRPEFSQASVDQSMKFTDRNGRFRLTAIPGEVIILARLDITEKLYGEDFSPYRRAVRTPGRDDELYGGAGEDAWVIMSAPNAGEPLDFDNAVKVVDLKENGTTVVDLYVDRGKTAKIVIQDPDGRPLTGVLVAGLADYNTLTFRVPDSTATIYALDPKNPRRLVLYDPKRKLGGTAVIRGDEKEPVTVRLAPLGRITGRAVAEDGKPLAGITISPAAGDRFSGDLYRNAQLETPVTADKDGRFAIEGMIPGVSLMLIFHKEDQYFVGKAVGKQYKLKPGETLSLGDMTLKPNQ